MVRLSCDTEEIKVLGNQLRFSIQVQIHDDAEATQVEKLDQKNNKI